MSVRGRVDRLERGPMGALARCRLCGGLGKPCFRVEYDPDIPPTPEDRRTGPTPPEPEGCPLCGRARVTIIRVRYDDTPIPQENRT